MYRISGILLFVFLVSANADSVKMRLERPLSEGEKMLRQGKVGEYIKWASERREQVQQMNKDVQPLYEYSIYYYTTQLGIGTPPQNFTMVVDFMNSDLWVPDISSGITIANCTQPDKTDCFNKTLFDSSLSSTYKKDGHVFLNETSKNVGFIGVDTIKLGDKLKVPGVKFGRVNKFEGRHTYDIPNYYMNSRYDGAIGVGPYSQANPGFKSAFQTAIDNRLVNKPVVTLWQNSSSISGYEMTQGAQLTWGDLDPEHCSSNVTYLSTIPNTNWQLQVNRIQLNENVTQGSWTAGIGYGAVRVDLIEPLFNQVIKELKAKRHPQIKEAWCIDCSLKFNWTVTIEGTDITLDENLLRWNDGNCGRRNGYCTLIFEKIVLPLEYDAYQTDIILGKPFADKFCYIYDFDKKQLGLAKDVSAWA